jgi:hypothetical protein
MASAYQKFIARHVKGSRGARQTRSRFKAAVKAWRSRGRRNPVLPGVDFGPSMVYNRGVYRAASGRYAKRGRRKLRRIKGGGWRSNKGVYRAASGRYAKRGGRKLRRMKGGGWRSNQAIWAGTPNPRRGTRKGQRRKTARRAYRRNPVFRTRSGRYGKRGYRRLRRIPGGGWKANAILPYTAFNNPVEAITGTFEKLTDVDLWTKTILPISGGFLGTHIVSYQVFSLIAPEDTKFEGIVKHGSRVGTAVLLSAATGIITKNPDMAAKVLAGGLVAVLGGIVEDVIGLAEYKKISGMDGMDDLAEDLTEELKSRIASGVREAIEGEGDEGGQVSAFVTSQDLKKAPHLGDFMTEQALQRATVGTGMPSRPGGGPPRAGEEAQPLADLDVFSDALADGSLI